MSPLGIVSTIAETCPELHFPKLTELRISMDLVDNQFALIKRFMQPTVKTFSIEVWQPSHDYRRICSPHRTSYFGMLEYMAGSEERQAGDATSIDPSDVVRDLCHDIVSKMPCITHLGFFVDDVSTYMLQDQNIAETIHNLRGLETVELAQYATQLCFLKKISAHPTLHTVTAFQRTWPLRTMDNMRSELMSDYLSLVTDWDPLGDPPTADMACGIYGYNTPGDHIPDYTEDAFSKLTTLHLTTSVWELCQVFRRWPLRILGSLQRLNIDTSLFLVRSREDLQELMQLIAARFPALTELSIGSLQTVFDDEHGPEGYDEGQTELLQVEAALLRPLAALSKLTSLEVRATRSSCIPVRDWPMLLKAWPHLEVLVLDNNPRPVSVEGSELRPGDAPLDLVLQIFHDFCPKLRVLSLHVDGTLALERGSPRLPVPPSLSALELVLPNIVPLDSMDIDSQDTGTVDMDRLELEDMYRTACLAEYLHAVLPAGCGLHVMDHGDYGLCETMPVPEKSEDARHSVLCEWAALHEEEGKECRAKRCAETRGEVLVPVYVVPAGEGDA